MCVYVLSIFFSNVVESFVSFDCRMCQCARAVGLNRPLKNGLVLPFFTFEDFISFQFFILLVSKLQEKQYSFYLQFSFAVLICVSCFFLRKTQLSSENKTEPTTTYKLIQINPFEQTSALTNQQANTQINTYLVFL